MSETTHLRLPFLKAAQAQKHVTMNEALRLIDGMVQLSVIDRDLTTPPVSPAEGNRYIVASGGAGVWAGWDGSIAYWCDGAWLRVLPSIGWIAWLEDEALVLIFTATGWVPLVLALGFIERAPAVAVAEEAAGSTTGMAVVEETLSGLSGASVDSSITIPDRAIVLGVSCRTITTVTGAASFDCGIAGETSKFGGALGVAAGSTNMGVIGPTAFYADTPVRLTANGSAFTGGAVRVAIHTLTCGVSL